MLPHTIERPFVKTAVEIRIRLRRASQRHSSPALRQTRRNRSLSAAVTADRPSTRPPDRGSALSPCPHRIRRPRSSHTEIAPSGLCQASPRTSLHGPRAFSSHPQRARPPFAPRGPSRPGARDSGSMLNRASAEPNDRAGVIVHRADDVSRQADLRRSRLRRRRHGESQGTIAGGKGGADWRHRFARKEAGQPGAEPARPEAAPSGAAVLSVRPGGGVQVGQGLWRGGAALGHDQHLVAGLPRHAAHRSARLHHLFRDALPPLHRAGIALRRDRRPALAPRTCRARLTEGVHRAERYGSGRSRPRPRIANIGQFWSASECPSGLGNRVRPGLGHRVRRPGLGNREARFQRNHVPVTKEPLAGVTGGGRRAARGCDPAMVVGEGHRPLRETPAVPSCGSARRLRRFWRRRAQRPGQRGCGNPLDDGLGAEQRVSSALLVVVCCEAEKLCPGRSDLLLLSSSQKFRSGLEVGDSRLCLHQNVRFCSQLFLPSEKCELVSHVEKWTGPFDPR